MYEIKRILRENLPIILLTATISSLAGIGLTSIKENLFTIPFLLIVVPALNDMVGDFSCILTSRMSTSFKMGYKKMVGKIVKEVFFVSIISSIYLSILGWAMDTNIDFMHAIMIVFFSALSLIMILIVVTYMLTVFLLENSKDPDNFIIPIGTAIGDALSVFVFAFIVQILL